GTEICPKITSQPAFVLVLTVYTSVVRYRDISSSTDDEISFSIIELADTCSQVTLDDVHRHWRKVITVRQGWYSVAVSRNSGELLHIAIPWRNIFIAYRPIHTVAIT